MTQWLRFDAWPISVHVLIWSLLPVVVLALTLFIGVSAFDQVQTTSAQIVASRTTIEASSDLLQAVIDLETGVRGYALTGDPAFLEPYQAASLDVPRQVQALRDLVESRPDQLVHLDRVVDFVEDWHAVFARPVIEQTRAGEDARELIKQGIGKQRIDAIRAELRAFDASEQQALADRAARDRDAWQFAGLLLTGVLTTMIVSSAVAVTVGHRITRSLSEIARAAAEIAGGELKTRLPEAGRNELSATARAINRMAHDLDEARDELLAQNEALLDEIRVSERARGETRAILDATSDAMILVGPDRVFRGGNRRFGELLGIPPELLIGRSFGESSTDFDRIFADADALRDRLTGTASDADSQLVERVKQQWPVPRDLSLFSPPVHSEGGEYIGRLYAFRDVTHEARLDEQRRQLEAERARAAEVQADLLPWTGLERPDIQLAGRCIPALQVGGDFFDWYEIDGLIWLTLGDVMGKGMAAALLMATVRSTLRAVAQGRSPAAALNLAQSVLGGDLGHRDSYVTLFHGVYDPSSGRLTYVDAGHGYAFVRRADGAIERLTTRSLPLGMPFADGFDEGHADLGAGDVLLLYSDGLVEAAPYADAEILGRQLDGLLTAQAAVDRLTLMAHPAGRGASEALDDDLTIVALRAGYLLMGRDDQRPGPALPQRVLT